MSQGWISLHRILLEKPIWIKSTPEQKVILITLLLMANHKESEWEWEGEKFKVNPGQMVTSLESISEKCGKGITIQNVRTAIQKFEKYEFLTNKSTKTGRLITIVNWRDYQEDESAINNDTNKDLTDTQQRPNKDLTPNNNDNNDNNDNKNIYTEIQNNKILKKDKKNKYSEFVSMTEEEYKKLLDKHGEELTNKMIETLDNYKGSSGKKYKSDYRAILNWVEGKILKETNYKPSTVNKKTRFHTENGRTSNYTSQELEEIARKRRANS